MKIDIEKAKQAFKEYVKNYDPEDKQVKLKIYHIERVTNLARKMAEKLNLSDLKYIPLVFAGWIRYLMGINDNGEKFELSPDPLINKLKPIIDKLVFGKNDNSKEVVYEILSYESIFGLDLTKTPLCEKILNYFKEMNNGKNSVEETLKKYVN